MKSKGGYVFSVVMIQVLLLPVLLTVGAMAMSGILHSFPHNSDAMKMTNVLITFFGAIIVGGITGLLVSKMNKEKPDTAKGRYLALLLPAVVALIFAALAFFLSKDNYNGAWWGVYFWKNPMFFIVDLGLAFSGLHYLMPILEISGYLGFVGGFMLYEGLSKTFIKNRDGNDMLTAFLALCAAFIMLSYVMTDDILKNGYIEMRYGKSAIGQELTEYDLQKIAPFKEGNGLAKLDQKASLQYTNLDEMPRLDGATAAYPVYAAFVQEVYKGLGDYYSAQAKSAEPDKGFYDAFVTSDTYPYNIVMCTKTTGAYENLLSGKTDIIFCAEPSKTHAERVKAKGDEFVLTPIASEAFVFFTNKVNPVENLTLEQVQGIYSGKITNWKEVGGKDKSILAFQRPENSGSQTIMQNKVMKDVAMMPPNKITIAGGMGEIISEVAGYKNASNALGYSFLYYSSAMIRNNQIKYVAIDGVKPIPETVRNRTYRFTVPVYAVTLKSNKKPSIAPFIQWILSDEGQSLIEKTGYIPIK